MKEVRDTVNNGTEQIGEFVSILPATDTRRKYKRIKSSTKPNRKRMADKQKETGLLLQASLVMEDV